MRVADLPGDYGQVQGRFLICSEHGGVHGEFSALRGDYFSWRPEHEMRCSTCGASLVLARKRVQTIIEGTLTPEQELLKEALHLAELVKECRAPEIHQPLPYYYSTVNIPKHELDTLIANLQDATK